MTNTFNANGNVLTVKEGAAAITRQDDALNRVTNYINAAGSSNGAHIRATAPKCPSTRSPRTGVLQYKVRSFETGIANPPDRDRLSTVSPNLFSYKNYRFFFFSLEEPRVHVHVLSPDGEAKFWIEPQIELAMNHGFKTHQISELERVIKEHEDEIRNAWIRHFGR